MGIKGVARELGWVPWGQGSGEWGEIQLLVWEYCHGSWDCRVMVSSAMCESGLVGELPEEEA